MQGVRLVQEGLEPLYDDVAPDWALQVATEICDTMSRVTGIAGEVVPL